MNPLTYLGFTIFSIIMQFCVMEFIHEKFQLDKDTIRFNESVVKKNVEPIENINRQPHALFYRTETDETALEKNKDADSFKYSNLLLEDATSTDTSITDIEVFYENTSIADDFFTTESYFTSSEFDNVTEITFLNKSNTTKAKDNPSKRKISKEKCLCNLLYKQCDIHCCCDTDCTEEERNLFINCGSVGCDKAQNKGIYFCKSYSTCNNFGLTNAFDDIFCIVKVNIPEKRIKSHYKFDDATINATFKWNTFEKSDNSFQYKKNKYQYGDPIILLKNEVLLSLNLPTTLTNNYCNGRKPLKFLIDENIKCNFKLNDFYMLSASDTFEETKLVSNTEFSSNNTILNCSTLHCTNWNITACNDYACGDYNKTIHSPVCTDDYCDNYANTMVFTFQYFDSKIINANLKMYLTKVPVNMPLFTQEITVKWYLGNESIENIIQLSGNPGYISGMPVITSSAANNHSSNFYNRTYGISFLSFPENINGQCKWLHSKNKTLLFGLNVRWKCRLRFRQDFSQTNATSTCQTIQTIIKDRLNINQILFISPYGNPQNVSDDKWVQLEISDRILLYGEYRLKKSKLMCYNLATRYEFVFAYADTSAVTDRAENRIVKATVGATQSNVSFDKLDSSTVLTIDISFIDISKPLIQFARAPHLNIHLPENFFFDFPLNNFTPQNSAGNIVSVLLCYLVLN